VHDVVLGHDLETAEETGGDDFDLKKSEFVLVTEQFEETSAFQELEYDVDGVIGFVDGFEAE
jgi:hypothetical protein